MGLEERVAGAASSCGCGYAKGIPVVQAPSAFSSFNIIC